MAPAPESVRTDVAPTPTKPDVAPAPEVVPVTPEPEPPPPPPVASDVAWKRDLGDDVLAAPPGAIARIGTRRFNLLTALPRAALSPDGTAIALGGRSGTIQIWSFPGGELLREIPSAKPVAHLAFSPDGARLAVRRTGEGVAIYDAADPDARTDLEAHTGSSAGFAFFDGGRRIATAGRTSIHLSDARTGKLERVISADERRFEGFAITEDGSRIVVRDSDRLVMFDGQGALKATGTLDKVRDFAFSPADDRIAAFTHFPPHNKIHVLSPDDLGVRADWTVNGDALAWSPDGAQLVVSGYYGLLQAYDVDTGAKRWSTATGLGYISQLHVTPDGRSVVLIGTDAVPRVADLADGAVAPWTEGHLGPISDMELSGDGSRLLVGYGPAGRVAEWDLERRALRQVSVSMGSTLTWVAYAPGERQWNAGHLSVVNRWDAATGARLKTGDCLGLATAYDRTNEHFYAFLGNDRCIFQANGDKVVSYGHDNTVLPEPTAEASSYNISAIAPRGAWWVVASDVGVRALRSQGRRSAEHTDIQKASALIISPSSRYYAVGTAAGELVLLDGRSDRVLLRTNAHVGPVRDIGFTRDERFLATVGEDARAHIWSTNASVPVATIDQPGAALLSVVFTADGCQLLVGGEDATITVWEANASCRAPAGRVRPDR